MNKKMRKLLMWSALILIGIIGGMGGSIDQFEKTTVEKEKS